jgi:transaldolase
LWASTSTKDPAYSEVKYVDALIAPETVNTLPMATLEAYRRHGRPAVRIEEGLEAARGLEAALRSMGVDLAQVAERLEHDGVQKFIEPFDRLAQTLARRRAELGGA